MSYTVTLIKKEKSQHCGEPTISLHSYTVPLVQWSTRLLPVMRNLSSVPGGGTMWNWDSPVSVVSLHWWPWHNWSLWPCLRQASSRTFTRPCSHADNVIIPLDLTQLFFPGFTLAAGPPSSFTTDIVGCWGEPCGETAISLHSYTVPVVHPFASRHEGPRFNPQLMWNWDSPVSVVSLQPALSLVLDWLVWNVYTVVKNTSHKSPKVTNFRVGVEFVIVLFMYNNHSSWCSK